MANTNLPQPDTTADGKTTPRWMFLLWQYVLNWAGNSSDAVISSQAFAPRPINQYTEINAVKSTTILANQIFGS